MPPRSSPSITSTTKRAKCLSGSHSSTDGGRRNAARRSKSRKLLIAIKPPFGANQWRDSSENQRRWVKSDRLLARPVKRSAHSRSDPRRCREGCHPLPAVPSRLIGVKSHKTSLFGFIRNRSAPRRARRQRRRKRFPSQRKEIQSKAEGKPKEREGKCKFPPSDN